MMPPRVRARKPIFVAVAIVTACHATEPLEPLTIEDAASVFFVGERDEAPAFTYAFTVAPDGAVELPPLASRPGDRWWAVANACDLETLGVDDGGTVLDPEPAFDANPFPEPIAVRSMSPSAEGTWSDAAMSSAVDEALRRFPLDPEYLCASVEPQLDIAVREVRFDTPDLYLPTFVTELDDGRIFTTLLQADDFFSFAPTSTTGYSAYTFELGNSDDPVQIDVGPNIVLGGYQAPDGEVWLVTTQDLLRGHPDTGFTVAASLAMATPYRRVWVSGMGSADATVLAISTSAWDGLSTPFMRRVLRYEAGNVVQVDADDRDEPMPQTTFLDNGDLFVINLKTEPQVATIYGTGAPRTIPVPDEGRFFELLDDPNAGLLLRHSDNKIFRFDGAGFELFLEDVSVLGTRFDTPTGTILAGNAVSRVSGKPSFGQVTVVQHLERTGVCSYPMAAASISAVNILPLAAPGTVLATELSATPGQLRATTITLDALADPCLLR